MVVMNFTLFRVIPCYTRAYFLMKYTVSKIDNTMFYANLTTNEGFSFSVKVTNNTDATYLSGRVWNEFIRVYGLEVGQEIYFTIGDYGPDTRVTTGNYPKFHPSKICTTYFFLTLLAS